MRTKHLCTAALLGVLALLAACSAPPQPAAPPAAPAPAALPQCAATTTGVGADGSESVAGDNAGQGDLVVLAEDDEGRPEVVPTDVEHAAAAVADLEQAGLRVVGLEVDQPVTIDATTAAAASSDPRRGDQWALDHLGIDALRNRSRGQGIDVAVIDTGVASGHVDLGATACSGVAFLSNSGVARAGQGAQDPNGHGTHVAGIIAATMGNGVGTAGVAPGVRLIPVRVLSAEGSGWASDVARGIRWSVDHGAEVINLSLGGDESWSVTQAVDYAESKGVVVIAAAGNDGTSKDGMSPPPPNYPGALDDVVAVASLDANAAVSSFSSRGDYVDVAAPGRNILSTVRTGGWEPMSGTSMATPHVAGVVAMLLAVEPGLTPAEVRARLAATAQDAGPVGHDHAYGWGRLDPAELLGG
jgi:subtilisin family serine protease